MTSWYKIALEMTRNFEKIYPKKPIINMIGWMRNQLTKLCNAVSAPVAAMHLQKDCESTFLLYNRILGNMGYGEERLKDNVENGKRCRRRVTTRTRCWLNITWAWKSTKRRVRFIPELLKTDVDSYFDQTKPHIKTLIKNQL